MTTPDEAKEQMMTDHEATRSQMQATLDAAKTVRDDLIEASNPDDVGTARGEAWAWRYAEACDDLIDAALPLIDHQAAELLSRPIPATPATGHVPEAEPDLTEGEDG